MHCGHLLTFGTDRPRTYPPHSLIEKVKNQIKTANQCELQGKLGWNTSLRRLVGRRQSPKSWGDRQNASVLDRFIAVIIIGTETTSLRLYGGRNWASIRRHHLCLTLSRQVWLTELTSNFRHSFKATLLEATVSHRSFHCCDAGALVSASDLCDH